MYINFLLEPQVAKANAEYITYATPNSAVLEMDDYLYKDNQILYPSKENTPKTFYYHNLDKKVRQKMDKLWEEVKLSKH